MAKILSLSLVFFLTGFLTLHSPPAEAAGQSSGGGNEGRVTYDIGVSSGSENSTKTANTTLTYTEMNLGLNYYVLDYLAWRNALFGRFASGEDNIYGLDSSLRLIGTWGGRSAGLTAFVAPGFRFQSEGTSAPFGEAGVVFHAGGLSLGGGVKTVLNSWVKTNQPNDSQVFLIIGGGGTL